MAEKKIGALDPFRKLKEELEERAEKDSDFRGDHDPVVIALKNVSRQLDEAIVEAEEEELTITMEEYAEREGISRGAAYKRFQAGGIPGAEKRPGVGIVIPADYAALKNPAA